MDAIAMTPTLTRGFAGLGRSSDTGTLAAHDEARLSAAAAGSSAAAGSPSASRATAASAMSSRAAAASIAASPAASPTSSPAASPAVLPEERRRSEDAAILARIVARDERAVEELYARYSGPLYSLAYQVTRAERFAQDVVQEVFIAVWRDAARFDPARGSVAPWLFSLARHKAIDFVRREQNVRKRTADVDLELREADDDVDGEAWASIRRDRVREAVTRLTPLQREALNLAFFEGLTHTEVADALGIPLGTAKTRIRSALLRLRDILGDSVSELAADGGPLPG